MKKVTKISEALSFLTMIKEEFGDLPLTLNVETFLDNGKANEDLSYGFGDDDIYIAIMDRDKNTDPNPDEKETVVSIQNIEKDLSE